MEVTFDDGTITHNTIANESNLLIEISIENKSIVNPASPINDAFLSGRQSKVIGVVFTFILLTLFSTWYLYNDPPKTATTSISAPEALPPLAKQFLSLAKFHQFKDDKENKLNAISYYQQIVVIVPDTIQAYEEIAYLNIDLMSLIPNDKNLFYVVLHGTF